MVAEALWLEWCEVVMVVMPNGVISSHPRLVSLSLPPSFPSGGKWKTQRTAKMKVKRNHSRAAEMLQSQVLPEMKCAHFRAAFGA